MRRRQRPSKQRLLALEAFYAGEPTPDIPSGERARWPRHWAIALEGLQGTDLEAELERCPRHLRRLVRYYVTEYFPSARQRAIDADIACLNERLHDAAHNEGNHDV